MIVHCKKKAMVQGCFRRLLKGEGSGVGFAVGLKFMDWNRRPTDKHCQHWPDHAVGSCHISLKP